MAEQKGLDTASSLKDIISHAKEYGFVFPSSEIYDGLQAVYDYGQNGVELKNNLKTLWWKAMTMLNDNVVGIDASIFMHPKFAVLAGVERVFKYILFNLHDVRGATALEYILIQAKLPPPDPVLLSLL